MFCTLSMSALTPSCSEGEGRPTVDDLAPLGDLGPVRSATDAGWDCAGACCRTWDHGEGAPRVLLRTAASQALLAPERTSDVYVMFEFQAAEDIALPPRPPLDLALVLDRSGSMADAGKLDFAKRAAIETAARLTPNDRLALVAYSDAVEVPWPLAAARGSDAYFDAVHGLAAVGSTSLHGGLVEGCAQVSDRERVRRVILLSDGLANVGPRTPIEIGRVASDAREQGTIVSAIGLGLQYDEEVMAAVATAGSGHYLYAREAESLSAFLGAEIEHESRVLARGAELAFTLGPGVEVVELYGNPVVSEGRRVRAPLEDFVLGETRQLLVRLRVEGGIEPQQLVGDVRLRYNERELDGAEAKLAVVGTPDLTVAFEADATRRRLVQDLSVRSKLEVVRGALTMEQALELRAAGDERGALKLLRDRARELRVLNRNLLDCSGVHDVEQWLDRRAQDLEDAIGKPDQGRDAQLGAALQGLGYL